MKKKNKTFVIIAIVAVVTVSIYMGVRAYKKSQPADK